jgi:hypothetical protein
VEGVIGVEVWQICSLDAVPCRVFSACRADGYFILVEGFKSDIFLLSGCLLASFAASDMETGGVDCQLLTPRLAEAGF